MYRRRSPRRGDCPLALCCMAFGLGVLLALCGELRTALVFAAIGLVILGFRCRRLNCRSSFRRFRRKRKRKRA